MRYESDAQIAARVTLEHFRMLDRRGITYTEDDISFYAHMVLKQCTHDAKLERRITAYVAQKTHPIRQAWSAWGTPTFRHAGFMGRE